MTNDTTVDLVTMTDGRTVEFAGKRRLLKSSGVSEIGECWVRLDFRNGETRLITLPEPLVRKFAGHGAEQKYGDATADCKGDIDDMILAVDELDESIQRGEWSSRGEGSGMSGTSILLRALVEYTGKPVASLKLFLKGKKGDEKLKLRTHGPQGLRDIIARLEAEKSSRADNVDINVLLEEVEAL